MSHMSNSSAPWTRPGPWVIKSHFRDSGRPAWWGDFGTSWDGWLGIGLVSARGNATHYDDYAEALEKARHLRESNQINEYEIEDLTRPRHSGIQGSSGRA